MTLLLGGRRVFGELGTPSGIDGVTHKYPENNWEDDPSALWPLIGIDEILSIQGLVMKLRNDASRSKLNKPGRHGFAALNSIHTMPDEVYDGSLEEYLSVRVAKERRDPTDPESFKFDDWSMRIRFRQNELTEEQKKTSYLDEFLFSWERRRGSLEPEDAHVQAWYANSMVSATDYGTGQEWRDIQPIDTKMAADLQVRLRQHMLNASISDVLRKERSHQQG